MFFSMNLIQNKCPLLVKESCPEILEPEFLSKFQDEFLECLYYFPEIMTFIAQQSKKQPTVWCHPNLNLDNAYFYRGEDGKEIKCGGLDFGGYGGCMIPVMLSGSIGGMDDSIYVPQHENLIKKFCSEYSAASGEYLDGNEVHRDFTLLSTMKSLICTLCSLKVFETIDEQELAACKSERDPPIVDDFYGRCFVKMTITSFNRWSKCHAHETFKQWKKDEGIDKGCCGCIAYSIFYCPWGWLHTLFMKFQVALYNCGLLKAFWCLFLLGLIAMIVVLSVM